MTGLVRASEAPALRHFFPVAFHGFRGERKRLNAAFAMHHLHDLISVPLRHHDDREDDSAACWSGYSLGRPACSPAMQSASSLRR